MKIAAGILLLTTDRHVLLLRRGPGYPDHGGEWDFPGGHVEEGETPIQGAERECTEEIGQLPQGNRTEHARRIAEDVDYTTFICRIAESFTPELNDEHVDFTWAPIGFYPEPLHPGVRVALDKLEWDETQVAQAIRDGDLTSPQRFHNVWLFAIRITGTGTAFRSKLDEVVYRPPELYLNDQFLSRCNGLPVVLEHPKKKMLDSQEFSDRIVGSIMLPYVSSEEVWGIARIYDASTAQMMTENQLSTSPGVVFTDPSVNNTMAIDGEKTLLIEGKPLLLDHLAICELGVWDKGGPPVGVQNDGLAESETRTDEASMSNKPEEKKEEAKADAAGEMMSAFDAFCSKMDAKMDAIGSRLDAMEEKKDAKKDDDAKKDAESEEEKEEEEGETKEATADKKGRKDKARKDARKDDDDDARKDSAEIAGLRADIAKLTALIPVELPKDEAARFAQAQAKADRAYQAYADSAPRPLNGEGLLAYRRRLASGLKQHSPAWKGVDLAAIADEQAIEIAENVIYADSIAASSSPVNIGPGQLRERNVPRAGGLHMSEFHGDPDAWMAQFKTVSQVRRIMKQARN